jgi:hypothetical protein
LIEEKKALLGALNDCSNQGTQDVEKLLKKYDLSSKTEEEIS